MQYKCELLDLLMNTPNIEVMWVKKVEYNTTVNMEFCDYMICSSSATNLGTDVLRTVSNATLVYDEKTENGYDIAVYKNVSLKTTITQVRQYSQTIAIGIKCLVGEIGVSNVQPMTLNFVLDNQQYVNGNARIALIQTVDVTNYKYLTVNSAYRWDSKEPEYIKIDSTDALSVVGQTIDISEKDSVRIYMLKTDGYAADLTLNITLHN